MKRLLFLFVLLAVLLPIIAQAATVKVTFDYAFSVDQACTASVTNNCIDHFEVWDGAVLTGTKLGNVPLPAGAGTVDATGIQASFPISGYGMHTLSVVAVARDGTGSPSTQSAPATASVVVKPGSPKNVAAQ